MQALYTSTTPQFKLEIFHDDDGGSANPRDNDNAGTMITWERQYSSPDANDWALRDESGFRAFLKDWRPKVAGVCPNCGNDGTMAWKERYFRQMDFTLTDRDVASPLEDELDGADGGGYINCTWCGEEWVPGPGMGEGGVALTLYRGGYNGEISVSDNLANWTEEDHEPDGVIFVTAETIAKDWGAYTKDPETYNDMPMLDWVAQYLRGEVKEYSTWAVGNVYGYVLSERKHVHVTVTDRDTGDTVRDENEDRWEEVNSCWGFITEDPDDDLLDWGDIRGYVETDENFEALKANMKMSG